MDKDFEKLIDKVMDENDEALRDLAELDTVIKDLDEVYAWGSTVPPRNYILTEGDRQYYTKAYLDEGLGGNGEDGPLFTLRDFLSESAEQFGEVNPDLYTLSDEAIFELADWYEYLWTK